jgi:predicted dehydrogenase
VKVLVAGLGSIGQRHVRNLRARFGESIDILAYRTRGYSHVIAEDMTISGERSVEDTYGLRSFDSLDDALAESPSAAFICNPTSMHVATALAAARAGCHLFIEKPVSHSLDDVNVLEAEVRTRRLVATVGYQLRFHPALLRAHTLIACGEIGAVRSVRAEFGEYLPNAHPYEDYRISYAAQASLGGGVILCYIHEVDYLCWLFGQPRRVYTAGGTLGELGIDVEDTAITSMVFDGDNGPIPAKLQLSFLQRSPTRACTIVGDKGTLHLDLLTPALAITTPGTSREERFDDFRRNDMFQQELGSFFNAVAGEAPPAVSLGEGISSLRVALAMRESLSRGGAVELRS